MSTLRRTMILSLGLLAPLAACGSAFVQSADLGGKVVGVGSGPAPWGKSLSGNYLSGRHAERSFDFGEAADRLSTALTRDPENTVLRQRVFLLQLSEGDGSASLQSAKQLENVGVALPLVSLRIAIEAARSGDFSLAEQLLNALEPNRYQAFLRPVALAWLKLANGTGIDAALAELEALSSEASFAPLYMLHKGLLNDVAGKPEAAEQAFTALLERDPTPSLRILQLVGNFFERHGQAQRAGEMYDAYRADLNQSNLLVPVLSESKPDPLVPDAKSGLAEAVFDIAGALYEDRDSAMALIYSRLASFLTPDSPMISLLVGEILEAEDRHADALAAYRAIAPTSPFAAAAALRVAHVLDEQQNTDEAVAGLRSLAAARPDDPEPLITLGHILRARERFAEAAAAYDEGIARVPELQPRHWSLLYSRGIALERSGSWQRAEEDLKKALAFEPDQPYVLNYLGYSWVDQGVNLAEAEKLVQRAVELRPNDGFIADSLGWVYFRTDRLEKAVELLERAVALEPGDPTINEHLGDVYWKTGRRNEARFQWSHALQLNPDPKNTAGLQSKVQCGLGCQAKVDSH